MTHEQQGCIYIYNLIIYKGYKFLDTYPKCSIFLKIQIIKGFLHPNASALATCHATCGKRFFAPKPNLYFIKLFFCLNTLSLSLSVSLCSTLSCYSKSNVPTTMGLPQLHHQTLTVTIEIHPGNNIESNRWQQKKTNLR